MAAITMASPLMLTRPKYGGGTPSASLTLLTSSKPPFKATLYSSNLSCGPLRSSFLSTSSSSSSSLSSSFSGLSLGSDSTSNVGVGGGRSQRLVVRAGKAALCQTKRSRSRKSLARTHGFRARMSTTSGRAILKRRRAKGRQILCTKSNPSSGKRS